MKNSYKPKRPISAQRVGAEKKPSQPMRRDGALCAREERIDIARVITPSGEGGNVKAPSRPLPELLAPAGSLESLKAAICAGADAVYFGGVGFNARMNAKNFGTAELSDAVSLLHSCGKKAYITLNTLVHGKELEDYLRAAESAYLCGADALIVADLGGAAAIHRHLPELELHASTQMSGHGLDEARLLSEHGFSRMVCARELSSADLSYLVKNSPIEIEAFVHGALCVCHSGQCLFSSLVGGRSGNRGECAQPCRLPYFVGGKTEYPLSLKDLSLAMHVRELISMGVHSLKLEGRMKSPEYVFGVTRAFRTLLDEGRDATPEELLRLSKIFSRDGFTDGYFTGRIDHSMLGTRSDEQKRTSRLSLYSSERIDDPKPEKLKISASADIRLSKPAALTLRYRDIEVTALGATPEPAINAPLTDANVRVSLSKLGNTDFELEEMEISLDESVILPVSALNSLRRSACDTLAERIALGNSSEKRQGFDKYIPKKPDGARRKCNTARFYRPEQITEAARKYFDTIYLPLENYDGSCEGVVLPPVIFDSERERVRKMLDSAVSKGAKYALVGNLGAISLAKGSGLALHGDLRFNVYNGETVAKLEELGVESILLSPELTLPQIRDIGGDTSAAVYGRIPLMLLEKCVAREIGDCERCNSDKIVLTDRRGVDFPVLREYQHRSVIYNSVPTYMADKADELDRAGVSNRHFIFTVETPDEVDRIIRAYADRTPPQNPKTIRRM